MTKTVVTGDTTIHADSHEKTAFQNFCPLGCGWLEELYITETQAKEAITRHIMDFHKVSGSHIQPRTFFKENE